jgi:uncharacterized protein
LRDLINDIDAQFNLGVIYDNGQGIVQKYAEAIKWYGKAAQQGLPAAQFNLGFMYRDGLGIARDLVQAHMWLSLAAAGFPPSENRNSAAAWRDLLASKMTPGQIVEAKRLASEWKPK